MGSFQCQWPVWAYPLRIQGPQNCMDEFVLLTVIKIKQWLFLFVWALKVPCWITKNRKNVTITINWRVASPICFFFAVHFAPYLTDLCSMMLIWAAGARCKWRAHIHNRMPWQRLEPQTLAVFRQALFHWAILPCMTMYTLTSLL